VSGSALNLGCDSLGALFIRYLTRCGVSGTVFFFPNIPVSHIC
jgi:hypothetical protein